MNHCQSLQNVKIDVGYWRIDQHLFDGNDGVVASLFWCVYLIICVLCLYEIILSAKAQNRNAQS